MGNISGRGSAVGWSVLVVVAGSMLACSPERAPAPRSAPPNSSSVQTAPPAKPAAAQDSAAIQEWRVIGEFGSVRTVYVSPAGLRDRQFLAQVLHAIDVKERSPRLLEVWFFDDPQHAPQGVPMTDAQMLHWRAQYWRNRNTGLEKFEWYTVTNAKASPPDLSVKVDNIRPGYAE
jgi:hypothetical protein